MTLGGKEKGKAILPDLQKGQVRDKAAEMIGASPRYVQDAKQIAKDAPEILDYQDLRLRAKNSILRG
jgi:hypothetical protein